MNTKQKNEGDMIYRTKKTLVFTKGDFMSLDVIVSFKLATDWAPLESFRLLKTFVLRCRVAKQTDVNILIACCFKKLSSHGIRKAGKSDAPLLLAFVYQLCKMSAIVASWLFNQNDATGSLKGFPATKLKNCSTIANNRERETTAKLKFNPSLISSWLESVRLYPSIEHFIRISCKRAI